MRNSWKQTDARDIETALQKGHSFYRVARDRGIPHITLRRWATQGKFKLPDGYHTPQERREEASKLVNLLEVAQTDLEGIDRRWASQVSHDLKQAPNISTLSQARELLSIARARSELPAMPQSRYHAVLSLVEARLVGPKMFRGLTSQRLPIVRVEGLLVVLGELLELPQHGYVWWAHRAGQVHWAWEPIGEC